MRAHALLVAALLCLAASPARTEDAADLEAKGIAALKLSQVESDAIISAAIYFGQASDSYQTARNDEKATEMNSFLYWCKKKMTLQQMDAFLKGGDAINVKIAQRMKDLEAAPKPDEAQTFFDRANAYATAHPDEHLLIAIRFFEVADRFKGSDASLQALDRSLKEQLQDKSSAPKSTPLPVAVRSPENVPATSGNRAVPTSAQIKAAEKLIKNLFKDDYAKTDASDRLALVAKLMQQSDENKGDAASQYVLLHEARDLAVAAGGIAAATDAQRRLRDSFKIDFAAMLLDLNALAASTKTAEPAAALATLLSLGADDALAVENYDEAVRFNSHAEDLLPLITDAELKLRLKAEIPRVQALRQASIAATAAYKTLTTKPDDPEANLTAGKFALQRGEFERAFAMLVKGKDGALSGLAKIELAPSTDATDQVKLADGWFDCAEKEPISTLKVRMQERAALWYRNALPALAGLSRLQVERRMATLEPGKRVNLLSLIDVTRDAVKGTWSFKDGILSDEKSPNARIEIPYQPPGEYDFRIVFMRTEGNDSVGQHLCKGNRQVLWNMDAAQNKVSGLETGASDKGVAFRGQLIKNNRWYTSIVQVRNSGITVFFDGKPILKYATNYESLYVPDSWKLRDASILGIGTWNNRTAFATIDLVEITGTGKKTR